MNLKENAYVTFPVHFMLLSFSKEFGRYLNNQIFSLVRLIPVSIMALSNCQEMVDVKLEANFVSFTIVPLMCFLPATYSKGSRKV